MSKDLEIEKIDMYYRACNYLSVGQLYLLDNPLLERPLQMTDIKKKLVGHWGTAPGQNFIYVHLNRIIKKYKLNMIYLSGPGHGGEAMIANSYLEGIYSKYYPEVTMDKEGMKKLFKRFSFPGGVSSHVSPEVPGSIHEGGELGYSLSHAYGAVLDNPDLIASCVVGDGEAETGPLATSWHLGKFLNPKNDGVILPILHLNGYKISNPTIFGRMNKEELMNFFSACGWKPYYLEGNDPYYMHEEMMSILKKIVRNIKRNKRKAKYMNISDVKWPMLILKTPKGWTGPKEVDGKPIVDSFRSHQIPINVTEDNISLLESWLRSYHPEELFDSNGCLIEELRELIPPEELCMSNKKICHGGVRKEIITPDVDDYAFKFSKRGTKCASDMMELGSYVRDLFVLNDENKNFRVFGPDEALSNRLNHVFEKTNRVWEKRILPNDEFLAPNGRVFDSFLSEHVCEGALEGYILTGRYGFMHSYEAFVRIIDSMASQHAKWIKISKEIPFRKEIPSLNYVLTSHIWQQDHNGYTHQDPGFLNHVATKKADTVRIYLPIDTNTLLSTFDHCIKTKDYINVIVASKHPQLQWLSMKEAKEHCKKGIGILNFASSEKNPDLVLACCGDTPTLEVLAATKILNEYMPSLQVRVVNVIDLMKLVSDLEHPHGMSNKDYDALFTKTKPIIFAFHGYPNLIHQLAYKRTNKNLHVHGYIEEGTITTPFDMRVKNKIDRYHLILNALKYIDKKKGKEELIKYCNEMLEKHEAYIVENGIDMEEIRNFKW